MCTINELTDELLEKNFNDINDKESSEWKESDDEQNADFERNSFDIII